MTFGEFLKSRRTRKNISQTQIAEKLGICKQIVSRWENNISLPDIMLIPKIAEILHVQPLSIMETIWKNESRIETFNIEVDPSFNINLLGYGFENFRKIEDNVYSVRCTNNKFESFIDEYKVEPLIKVIGPSYKVREIIMNNMKTCCNYSEKDKSDIIISRCFERCFPLLRPKKSNLINRLSIIGLVSKKYLSLNKYESFKQAYYESKSFDEYTKFHRILCEEIIELYRLVFNENNISLDLFGFEEIKYRLAIRTVNLIFQEFTAINLLDKNHENYKYLYFSICANRKMMISEYEYTTYEEYLETIKECENK